jgi:hypothetical protein
MELDFDAMRAASQNPAPTSKHSCNFVFKNGKQSRQCLALALCSGSLEKAFQMLNWDGHAVFHGPAAQPLPSALELGLGAGSLCGGTGGTLQQRNATLPCKIVQDA